MSLFSLDGKIAVITGSSRGIGKATARLFARHGARVALLDLDEAEVAQAAFDLAAEGVPAHSHVDAAERLLVRGAVEDAVGEQDHPGTGAERRHPRRDPLLQRLEQVEGPRELGHRGGLAARDHQAVAGLELGGTPHGDRVHTEPLEHPHVLADVALDGEDTDGRQGRRAHDSSS